ncbi:hypothetical protein U8527_18240 [Kordia algicida OT-1]|uniref:Uncharacterized protein n=1 Tax=Kordia algicida OT-1 TaxID=391587 RepID=A9DIM4_9FLAO|nr:hypothetical protein [Kordia algicida]EDP97933.1 hypothetical protein KAOT1_11987 [Kordia algicida OT-1]
MKQFLKSHKISLFGGLIAASFTGIGVFLLGNISGYQAKQLLESSLSGLNMLCNTIVLASATILALLLTLLSISSGSKNTLKKKHYKQVLTIARFDVILFISALMLFQFFNMPIIESDEVPTSWFSIIYWLNIIFSSIISGMMITVILMLYRAVTNIIAIVGLDEDRNMLYTEDDEEKMEESKEDIENS